MDVITKRMTAAIDDEVVVFLIGMRINHPWKVHKWWPVAMAMPRMIRELYAHPELGFLHAESWLGRTTILLQYWKSFEALEAYAKSRTHEHLPAWAAFNRNVASNGDVGIWHETYRVRAGDYECFYNNMPPFGLAQATSLVPASGGRETAAGRMATRTTPTA
jgi:hypothetical protein